MNRIRDDAYAFAFCRVRKVAAPDATFAVSDCILDFRLWFGAPNSASKVGDGCFGADFPTACRRVKTLAHPQEVDESVVVGTSD